MKTFFKNLEYCFLIKSTKIENAPFPHQKPILRQIKWWLSIGPITKNGVLPVTTLFFWKLCLGTSYKELICSTNSPNAHICSFCKRWSFLLRLFFPVSILKEYKVRNIFPEKSFTKCVGETILRPWPNYLSKFQCLVAFTLSLYYAYCNCMLTRLET